MSGVRTEVRGAVLEVTIDRPPANAIDAATSRELGEAFAALRDDPSLRAGVVTGGGDRFFSAGWDLKAAAAGEDEDSGPAGSRGSPSCSTSTAGDRGRQRDGGRRRLRARARLRPDRGGAGRRTVLPEVNLGFVPDAGGVVRLPRRLPRALAMELLLTGRRMGADEAPATGS